MSPRKMIMYVRLADGLFVLTAGPANLRDLDGALESIMIQGKNAMKVAEDMQKSQQMQDLHLKFGLKKM